MTTFLSAGICDARSLKGRCRTCGHPITEFGVRLWVPETDPDRMTYRDMHSACAFELAMEILDADLRARRAAKDGGRDLDVRVWPRTAFEAATEPDP